MQNLINCPASCVVKQISTDDVLGNQKMLRKPKVWLEHSVALNLPLRNEC